MTPTPKLVVVLFRLYTFDADTSLLMNLYDEYGSTKENLGQDLYNILKNNTTSALYAAVLMQELQIMTEEVSSDLPLFMLFEELRILLSEIRSKLSTTSIQNSRLVGIDIEGRDTLVLTYRQGRP